MSAKPDLQAFLVRAVLDEDFRSDALAEPDRIFSDFNLTEAQKDVLRRRDKGMLALLGDVLRASAKTEMQAEADPPPKGRRPAVSFVPEATLLLRILSSAVDMGENKLHVSYSASLHVAPDGMDLREAAAQLPEATELPGKALPDVTMAIHITPEISVSDEGELEVSYSGALQNLSSQVSTTLAPGDAASLAPAAHSALEGVMAAPKEEQVGKILELIEALESDEAEKAEGEDG